MARYLRRLRRRGDPAKSWLTFLQNHREAIAAFDFFIVPTVTFQLLYCFFVIERGRRRILRFNVTDTRRRNGSCNNCARLSPKRVRIDMPSSIEISTFSDELVTFLEATGLKPKRTSVQAPCRMEWPKDGLAVPAEIALIM
jgi:hypothetical protein